MAEAAPRAPPAAGRRFSEANEAAPTRAPEAARPRRTGSEVRLGMKGILSPIISATASTWSAVETPGEPRAAKGVSSRPPTRPCASDRLKMAGAAIERNPAIPPKPRAFQTASELPMHVPFSNRLPLGQRAPDLELSLYVPDHLVCELRGACRAAEVGGPVAFQDRLEGGLVDRARDPVGLFLAEEGEEGGAREDHGHRVGHVLA